MIDDSDNESNCTWDSMRSDESIWTCDSAGSEENNKDNDSIWTSALM